MGQEWAGKGWVTDFGCLVIIIGLFSLCLSHFEFVVCIYFNFRSVYLILNWLSVFILT